MNQEPTPELLAEAGPYFELLAEAEAFADANMPVSSSGDLRFGANMGMIKGFIAGRQSSIAEEVLAFVKYRAGQPHIYAQAASLLHKIETTGLSGSSGRKEAEGEIERLREALEAIANAEHESCQRCEGNGRLYADGKAHYYSEDFPTVPCGKCGGEGKLYPDLQQIAIDALEIILKKTT